MIAHLYPLTATTAGLVPPQGWHTVAPFSHTGIALVTDAARSRQQGTGVVQSPRSQWSSFLWPYLTTAHSLLIRLERVPPAGLCVTIVPL